MNKIVKLSLHKNTLEKRQHKITKDKAKKQFDRCMNDSTIEGYAFMSWNKKGEFNSFYGIKPESAVNATNLGEIAKTTFNNRIDG